jgi:acetate kinase
MPAVSPKSHRARGIGRRVAAAAGPVESRLASGKVPRPLEQIEKLAPAQQTALLQTIDTLLENATLKSARRA